MADVEPVIIQQVPEEKEMHSACTPSTASTTDGASDESLSTPADDVTGIRMRARTHSGFVEQENVELLVVEQSSLDSTMLATLGKHALVSSWKVLVAGRSQPVCIEVHVDKSIARAPMVSVTAREGDMQEEAVRIFPAFGTQCVARMTGNIEHKWTFRGLPRGFRERNFHEVRLPNPRIGNEDWIAATVTEWRQDGTFEARVVMEESFGVKREIVLVGLKAQDLRERQSGCPMSMISLSLLLEVPQEAPHRATLKLVELGDADNKCHQIDAKFLLGRWSPATSGAHCEALPDSIALDARRKQMATPSPTVVIKITRDKLGLAGVRANVGHRTLVDFMSGEVRAVASKTLPPNALTALKKKWKIQLGSHVEHAIEISRANRLTNVVTVTVDGVLLTQALMSDIGSKASDGCWQLPFRLVGDRFLEFQMEDSYTVAERGQRRLEQTMLPYYERSAFPNCVVTPMRYRHTCCIVMKDLSSLGKASLLVDNVDFIELPRQVPMRAELNVQVPAGKSSLDLFSRRYGIELPRSEIQNTYTRSVDHGIRRPVDALVETLPSMEVMTDSMASATSCGLDFVHALRASLASFWACSSVDTANSTPETLPRNV
eukprot:TRINITY_DN25521_c0_g3_i1.p1 TRINITY_DN25521_c0_g3~~TRINITY_DN25521_c0_g3_i1.p1  ORF type:complete len:614 (-),score=83.14 TRINITY_DN25521_c0_g3_i1:388-2199(-)